MRVRLFAMLVDLAGGERYVDVDVPAGATVGDVWAAAGDAVPALGSFGHALLFAVDREYVPVATPMADGQELAAIPPVSGGAGGRVGFVRVSAQIPDLGALVAAVADPTAGAIVTFVGTTREAGEGRVVEQLEYEAYPEMAEAEMARIAAEAVARFGLVAAACEHRIGEVPVGEVSVALAVSAAHRDAAYAGSRYLIDELKRRVPIWKRERWSGGVAWVGLGGAPAPAGDSAPTIPG